MIRRSFRVGLTLGLLGGLAFALIKVFGGRSEPVSGLATAADDPWPRLRSDPAVPVKKQAAKKKPLVAAWVEPKGDVCPTSHPVKAKLTSKIFHLPGMLNYERTNPDRCYRDAKAAESDGLRAAKR